MDISEFVYDEGASILNSFAVVSVDPSHTRDTATFDPRDVIVIEKHIVLGGGIVACLR